MKKLKISVFFVFLSLSVLVFGSLVYSEMSMSQQAAEKNMCIDCHANIEITPALVKDWQQSSHSENDITCDMCHGEDHTSENDVSEVNLPTPETCAVCHEERFEQFKNGKHALAWAAMNAMPSTHCAPPSRITAPYYLSPPLKTKTQPSRYRD